MDQNKLVERFFDSFGTDRKISILDNDLGLLAALRLAYLSKEDVTYRVSKSENDKRDYVPDVIYEVKRENGEITFSRTAADFLKDGYDRKDTEFDVEHFEGSGKYSSRKYKTTDLLPEEIIGELIGKMGRYESESLLKSDNFFSYLKALKSLSRQMSEGTDWSLNESESEAIGLIRTFDPRFYDESTKTEGISPRASLKVEIPAGELFSRVTAAEARVKKVEGAVRPEGQRPMVTGSEGGGIRV